MNYNIIWITWGFFSLLLNCSPDADFKGETPLSALNASKDANPGFEYSVDEDHLLVDEFSGLKNMSLKVDSDNQPKLGSLVFLDDQGNFEYRPDSNENGTDKFIIQNEKDELDYYFVIITINPVNDIPVLEEMSFMVEEDSIINDKLEAIDEENSPITFEVVESPESGVLELDSSTGYFSYTPDQDFYGTDMFTVIANDGMDNSELRVYQITVSPVNDAPIASDIDLITREDSSAIDGLLLGQDPEGDAITFEILTVSTLGVIENFNPQTGQFTFTPKKDATGEESLDYVVHDASATSQKSKINITIIDDQDAVIAHDIIIRVKEDPGTPATGKARYSNPENYPLAFEYMPIKMDKGTLQFNKEDGAFVFTPNQDAYTGNSEDPQSFEYSITYTNYASTEVTTKAKVLIFIDEVNDAPVAKAVSASGYKGDALSVNLNATDIDNLASELTFAITVAPANANYQLTGKRLTFTPADNGTFVFKYHVYDGSLYSNVSTATFTANSKSVILKDSFEDRWDISAAGFKWDQLYRDDTIASSNCADVDSICAEIVEQSLAPLNLGSMKDGKRSVLFHGRPGHSNHNMAITTDTFTIADANLVKQYKIKFDYIAMRHMGTCSEKPSGEYSFVCDPNDPDEFNYNRHTGKDEFNGEFFKLEICTQYNPDNTTCKANGWKQIFFTENRTGNFNGRNHTASDWVNEIITVNKADIPNNKVKIKFEARMQEGIEPDNTLLDGVLLDNVIIEAHY